jgi:DNA repair exonuclease SbcCD nuclease subunit
MRFIFRTDVHAADRGPESWKGDYPAEIWSNLRQIGEMAREHQARAVLDGGDFFHLKAATRNSHSLVATVASLHAAYPCPVYCVEGNHDIAHNNLNTIEDQPLGVLYATGAFKHLREEVFEEPGVKVRIVGVPYSPFRKLEELRALRKQDGEHLVAIVHALAGPDPPAHVEEFFGEPVFRYEDLVFQDGPDVWCFGHWHKDQGIVERDGRTFVNQGAVSRGALVRENLERTPKVALIEATPDGVSATSLPLEVLPAAEVFDLERKERRDAEEEVITKFVETLASSGVDPSADVDAQVATLDFAQEVRELGLRYLELARTKRLSG